MGLRVVQRGTVAPAIGGAAGSIATSVLPCVESATNHERFQERSFPALRSLNRYASGATCRTGYALPFTIGVSMNASGVPDGLGIIGHCRIAPPAIELAHGMVTPVPPGPAVRVVIGGKNHAP